MVRAAGMECQEEWAITRELLGSPKDIRNRTKHKLMNANFCTHGENSEIYSTPDELNLTEVCGCENMGFLCAI